MAGHITFPGIGGVAITGEFKIYILPDAGVPHKKGATLKLPVIMACAIVLTCFLPVSGLDLSRFPDLQAKYPGLDTAATGTTFEGQKDNFAERSAAQNVLLQKFRDDPGSGVAFSLADRDPGSRLSISLPGGGYSDMISKRLHNLTGSNSGSARSLLDNYTIKKAIPEKKVPATVPTTSDAGMKVVEANNQFALDLYSTLAQENPGGNLFFSPWSISSALAITYEGARGTTADEIRSVFNFPADDTTRWNGYKEITGGLNSGNSGYTLENANALWAEETYPLLPSYLTTADTYYSAHVTNLDFIGNPERSRETINRWVEGKTRDRIRDLLPPGSIDSATTLVITNAIYFKGTWASQFRKENTADADFMVTPATTVRVPMMKRTDAEAKYWYTETDTLQVLGMPYAHQNGRELAMLVILPKDQDLRAAEQSLDVNKLSELRQSLVYTQVKVFFPRFKMETGYQMRDILSGMGMPSVFEQGQADLSGMDGTTSLFVSDVFHKAFVEVNEEGTEAAAATAVPVSRGMAEVTIPTFRADHPFIFLIQDSGNGNILFMGRVVEPAGG
jgi:serpin B